MNPDNINQDTRLDLGTKCARLLLRLGFWVPDGHEPEPRTLSRALRRFEDAYEHAIATEADRE